MAAVAVGGLIDDYSGVRAPKNGRRFRIADATVWNGFVGWSPICKLRRCAFMAYKPGTFLILCRKQRMPAA
jgi:hypothetical protein